MKHYFGKGRNMMKIINNKYIRKILAIFLLAIMNLGIIAPASANIAPISADINPVLADIAPILTEMEPIVEIISFERNNPVHSEIVKQETKREELELPETIRAIIELPEMMDESTFVQAIPQVDMSDGFEHYDYYHYGYVVPRDVEALYNANAKAIYTLYYAAIDDEGQPLDTVGDIEYRVYGSLDGGEDTWFTCDQIGELTGVVIEVPVVWEDEGYDGDVPDEYVFTADIAGYAYEGEAPIAKVTVEEAENIPLDNLDEQEDEVQEIEDEGQETEDETQEVEEEVLEESDPVAEAEPEVVDNLGDCQCGTKGEPIPLEGNQPWVHRKACSYYSPIECMCRKKEEIEVAQDWHGEVRTETIIVNGDFSYDHSVDNADCPLYERDTVEIIKLKTGDKSVMGKEDAQQIIASQESKNQRTREAKELYPVLGNIEIVKGSEKRGKPVSRSINGGGANDIIQDNYMNQNTPTTGNADVPAYGLTGGRAIPGRWIDYLNTMWMNKAYNKFAWTPAGANIGHKGWAWSAKPCRNSALSIGDDPLRFPYRSNDPNYSYTTPDGKLFIQYVWWIYSGEQLRYAMDNFQSGDRIHLAADINLNGSNNRWDQMTGGNKSVVLEGRRSDNSRANRIYNLGCFTDSTTNGWTFFYSFGRVVNNYMVDIEFVTPKVVARANGSILDTRVSESIYMKNVSNTRGMVYSRDGMGSGLFQHTAGQKTVAEISNPANKIYDCYVDSSYVRGKDHTGGLSSFPQNVEARRISINDSLVISTGAHSGGLISCFDYASKFTDCYAGNVELYSAHCGGAFVGSAGNGGDYLNCFTSGKVEGYRGQGGFTGGSPVGTWLSTQSGAGYSPIANRLPNRNTFINCYSTALVGVRSQSEVGGGFSGDIYDVNTNYKKDPTVFRNCYAAGEVGTFGDEANSKKFGGFIGEDLSQGKSYTSQFTNCYYDKQTTAMREWVLGDRNTVTQGSPAGLVGVLTTDTKNGYGGTIEGLTTDWGASGFRGFTNNNEWVYTQEHYPQLASFVNASSSVWGSAQRAGKARAHSKASTATVMLNTWNEGYDWDDYGVRTKDVVNYARSLASTGKADHKGYEYTYDTVREITTEAPVTKSASWTHMIPGGAPVDTNGDGIKDANAMEVSSSQGIQIKVPGMDWFSIGETVNGYDATRPIRLIAYMDIEAGEDKEIAVGSKYNHRTDVELMMADRLIDDLVIGFDDNKIWSTVKKGLYPNSARFWALPTTNMNGEHFISKDAWLYTEIWRAKQNADGSFVTDAVNGKGSENLVPDISVKVTGAGTGNNTTLTEQKWNGDIPMQPDTSITRKYIVTYYWMLKDGRYRKDTKIITLKPGEYELRVNVKNDADDTDNNTALHIGTAKDEAANTAYVYSDTPLSTTNTTGIEYTRNSTGAWRKNKSDVVITKAKLEMKALDGTVVGTKTVNGNLKEGDTITIPIKYYYNAYEHNASMGVEVESMKEQTVEVIYTVAKDALGGYYLRFNKLKNPPADEAAFALIGGDGTGIPSSAEAYINDTQYNIELTLWVKRGKNFEFIKTDENGNPIAGVEFQLYSCTHVHDSDCGGVTDKNKCHHYYKIEGGEVVGDNHSLLAKREVGNCWDVDNPYQTVVSDENGKVIFEDMTDGDFMLVETKTKEGYQLPTGQWMIRINKEEDTLLIIAKGDEMPPAFKNSTEAEGLLELPNYPVLTLPQTGANRLVLFIISGIVLMGGGIIICIRKKGCAYL